MTGEFFETDLWGQVKGLKVKRVSDKNAFPIIYQVGDRPWLLLSSTTHLPGDPEEIAT